MIYLVELIYICSIKKYFYFFIFFILKKYVLETHIYVDYYLISYKLRELDIKLYNYC